MPSETQSSKVFGDNIGEGLDDQFYDDLFEKLGSVPSVVYTTTFDVHTGGKILSIHTNKAMLACMKQSYEDVLSEACNN